MAGSFAVTADGHGGTLLTDRIANAAGAAADPSTAWVTLLCAGSVTGRDRRRVAAEAEIETGAHGAPRFFGLDEGRAEPDDLRG